MMVWIGQRENNDLRSGDRIGARPQPTERSLLTDHRLLPPHQNQRKKVSDVNNPLPNIREHSMVGFRIDGKCQQMQFTSSH